MNRIIDDHPLETTRKRDKMFTKCVAYTILAISSMRYDEGSGEGDISPYCCVHGNCSCNSLDHVLANLASNVLINIMTD